MKNLFSSDVQQYVVPLYGRQEFASNIPAYDGKFPFASMLPETAYQLVRDEIRLDGKPSENFATFVNTWMDEYVNKLVRENINKNFIDREEYPESNVTERRVVYALANLCGASAPNDATPENPAKGVVGSCTIGSSETVMLGLIAQQKNWEKLHLITRKPTH